VGGCVSELRPLTLSSFHIPCTEHLKRIHMNLMFIYTDKAKSVGMSECP
jgi:hypothetical protein